LVAGLSCDIRNPGEVMLFDAAGPPIVITRDQRGTVHAFLNMCKHRGARVATSCGPRARLTCGFHGWSYSLDGKLVGIPGKEGFAADAAQKLGLTPVPVAERHGLIFVKLRPSQDPIDLDGFLGDFEPQLAMLNLSQTCAVKSSQLQTEANWKLMVNTHCEGYHFATLHPKTIAPETINNVSVYDRFGLHHRIAFANRHHGEIAASGDLDRLSSSYSSGFFIFPNTVCFVTTLSLGNLDAARKLANFDTSALYFGIYRLFPQASASDTHTIMASYKPLHAPATVDSGAWEQTHDFIERVLREEDYAISEEQFRTLSFAPTGHKVVYGRNEVACQDFQRFLRSFVSGLPVNKVLDWPP
jgi:nitrite reductase/ring-hydroxylating ferredoxin subunit